MSFALTHLIGFGAVQENAAATSVTIAYQATSAQNSGATTYTFSAMAIGTATATRKVVAVFTARSASASGTLSSCTIGGVSATCTTLTGSNNSFVAIACATVTSGTTGDVVPTWSTSMARCSCTTYSMEGAASTTPATTGSDTTGANYSASLTFAAGAAAFGGVTDADTSTSTWTNLTENVDSNYGGGTQMYSVASDQFVAAQTSLALTAVLSSSVSGAAGFAVFTP